ncbi:MAG: hypothetical protein ABJF04_05970 [Reichenbachiella sp.]|uniref:hypothetical protein n=1 Tax=Reichenbachiella sp. TaxID=2184521 RepID=UPI003267C22C
MSPIFTSNILSGYVLFINQHIGGIHLQSQSTLFTILILFFSFFNFDAIAQSEADRARIIEKNNQEALNKIIETENEKYEADLKEARRRGIPEVIIDQNGQIGSFHSLLPDGSPTYNFDDATINMESRSFQLPAKLRKKQVKKSRYPETVTDNRNLKGSLYAIRDGGQPIYYFQEMEVESDTKKSK